MSETYYVTTAIPYINAKPHIGHVLEWFQADTLARYHRLLGKDVAFTSGTDENSLKNVQAAEKAGVDVQHWLDEYAKIFQDAFAYFGIELTHFRRGSDQNRHWPGVQKLWQRCADNGDIYKKTYTGLYCVGCESFYTKEDLTEAGECPEHLTKPEKITEKNYFFRLTKYQDKILRLFNSGEHEIVSQQYKNEMLRFIERGLEDFSISRSSTRARGIGVPVPGDNSQVMYVWFDALAIYITALGWGSDESDFKKYWPSAVQVIGKGINRFHSIYWIGMLLSAKLSLPKVTFVHGYLTVSGQKMSKSLGNVLDPFKLVEEFGLEPIRHYLLRYVPTHADGDFSREKFAETYTADLANGIGNLCSRIAKLSEKSEISGGKTPSEFDPTYVSAFTNFEISVASEWIQNQIRNLDGFLSDQKPWKKDTAERHEILTVAVARLLSIGYHLQPLLPKTAEKIINHFTQPKIAAISPLFPRK
ncbi:MAG: methionine--tRNA ligase [Candidatus Pacebacteria bacterium]|nr:methionine--tRNA ligase [Candidatus Paceibacterota bacterium]PIR60466.1 MAG: methionine--tRNA ligase [Candidatus Pacebacteria bacterium CG10_big_fil_rev_8_21_14_0_10_44_54]